MTDYFITYFYDKFSAIPETRWKYERLSGGLYSDETKQLNRLLEPLTFYVHAGKAINDAFLELYTELGESPKERILNALLLVSAIRECPEMKEAL